MRLPGLLEILELTNSLLEDQESKRMRAQYSWFAMFSPSEVLELVMLCRQTAHSATDFSPMDGNAKLKNGSQHIAGERKTCRCTSIRLGLSKCDYTGVDPK